MDFRNPLGGLLYCCLLYFTSCLGTVVLVTPLLPVVFLAPRLGRLAVDRVIKLWFVLCVALCEEMMGIRLVVTGQPSRPGTSCLILANHRTRLDWLFFMSYVFRYNDIDQYKISLKAPLKYVPGAGWACQCAGFLFLQRNWDHDREHISQGLEYFSKVKSKPQYLLFPEGTDFEPNTVKRSNAFAEKKGYRKYEYVLHPKTTGFIHFVKEMKKGKILDSILDVSVAYPKNVVSSELQIVKGQFPEEIHCHVNNIPVSSLPDTDEELDTWCRQLWEGKEERLRKFYETKCFQEENTKDSQDSLVTPISDEQAKQTFIKVYIFWGVFLLVTAIAFFVSFYFRLFLSVGTLFYFGVCFVYGGVDNLVFSVATRNI